MIKLFNPKVIKATVIGAATGFTVNYAVTKILFKPERPLQVGGKTIPFAQGILPKTQNQFADMVEKSVNTILKNPKTLIQLQSGMLKAVISLVIKLIYEVGDKKTVNEILSIFLSNEKKAILFNDLKELIGKILVEKTDKEFLGTLLTNEGIKIFKEVTAGSIYAKLINEKVFASIVDALTVAIHKVVETSAMQKILDIVFKEMDSLMDLTIPQILKSLSVDEDKMRETLEALITAIFEDVIPHVVETVDFGALLKSLILKIDYAKVYDFLNTKCKSVLIGFNTVGAVAGGLTAKAIASRTI